MADIASLNDAEVTTATPSIAANTTHQVVTTSKKGIGSGRGRGSGKAGCSTRGLRVNEPMHLEFDEFLRPTGKWRLKYGQQIGLCMRKLNINWEWYSVKEGLKTTLWQETQAQFHIPDEPEMKKVFLSAVAKRFGDFKAKLVSGWTIFTRKRSKQEQDHEPYQIWRHIKEEDWSQFKKTKLSDEAKAKREKAQKSASQNDHHHGMGQRNYEESRKKWIDKGFYPSCKTTSISITITRGDDWYCAIHRKDKVTGIPSV